MVGNVDFIALCREFAEEVRNLQAEAKRFDNVIKDANAMKAPAVTRWNEIRNDNIPQTSGRLDDLLTSARASVDVRDDFGDVAVRLENLWNRVVHSESKLSSSFANGTPSAQSPAYLTELRSDLGGVAAECAFVTLPSRLRENLDSLRIGETLAFHEEFADEVDDESHRQAVFEWCARHSRPFSGVFDLERSFVIKASPSKRRRYASVGLVIVAAVAIALLPLLRHPLDLEDTFLARESRDGVLVMAVMWAYLGAFIHVILDIWKDVQRSRQTGRNAPSVSGWIMWIHVREISILFSILVVGVAAIASAHLTKGTDVVTMLAVGYSADSIFDLLQPKAVSLLTKRAESVTKLIKA